VVLFVVPSATSLRRNITLARLAARRRWKNWSCDPSARSYARPVEGEKSRPKEKIWKWCGMSGGSGESRGLHGARVDGLYEFPMAKVTHPIPRPSQLNRGDVTHVLAAWKAFTSVEGPLDNLLVSSHPCVLGDGVATLPDGSKKKRGIEP
jgi:hypothetical protein